MGVLDQKVAEIATKLNTLLEKAKTTDQFPYQANLNANSKIRVYTDGISEFIMVSQLLPSVEETDNKVLDYTIEWVKGTYTFKITVRKYIFNGVLHTNTIYAERTLGASDLVYNRFDSFLIDANEQIIVWPGDAVEFPYPKEFDLDTYVLINFFRVDANTTEPAGLNEILVFNEGTGAPGEWTMDYSSGTLNTTKFSSGAKCIKLVNKQSVAATAAVNFEGRFIKDVLIDVFCETAGNNRLRFSFWIANTMRVGDITVSHGQFNFNSFLIGQWQTIVIPGSAFSTSWGNSQYNYLWMNNDRSGSTVYLDNVRIQQTDIEQVSGTNHTHAQLSVLEQITQALLNAWNSASSWVTTNGANVLAHIANKQNSLATDGAGAKYPTVDAVNAGLATKLDASAYNQHFKGKYLTAAAMRAAHPTASVGDSAQVNEVGATTVVNYSWDDELGDWVQTGSVSGGAANTDELPEGTSNLYFTVTRFLANLTYANVIAALGFTPSTAPNNAQKNSDITKVEIEAKLIGEITSHTHPASGGLGDMVLADVQTVSGLKTFLYDKLGMRNAANTFTSFFRNANTAIRYYTLPNRDGTLLDNTDYTTLNNAINTKLTNPVGGVANYLSKFLTATTIGLSRLWDTGTFLGIGTVNSPLKDITLGNQANREIGVELSNSSTVGRDLIISAGKTINYLLNTDLNQVTDVLNGWVGMTAAPNNDIYVTTRIGTIYIQTNSEGAFLTFGQATRQWRGMTAAPNGDIYAVTLNGDIYKRTAGAGDFLALGQTSRSWHDIAAAANGDIYATVRGGDIYKQTNGTGDFIGIGELSRQWRGITVAPNGDIYATVSGGDIYKQVGGVGAFSGLGQTTTIWNFIQAAPNGNIYASRSADSQTEDIYVQIGGLGNFQSIGQPSRRYHGLAVNSLGDLYAAEGGDTGYTGYIYKQINNAAGLADLDGGALIHKAGTGKGTGKSRYQIITGQKTASGTDMQLETLRIEVDEDGNYKRIGTPVYADNAAALAGGLTAGMEYRTATGVKMEVY